MRFFNNLFNKPPKISKRKDAITYQIGGGWGNAINWVDKKEFDGKRSIFSVVGWKTPKPRVGDLLTCPMKSGKIARFIFKEIENTQDPPDMFFADVGFVGYERKE